MPFASAALRFFDARWYGEVEWFRLGDHLFEHLGVLFARATSGTYTTRGLAGSIGQDLMRPFLVVFDLRGARVAPVPKG